MRIRRLLYLPVFPISTYEYLLVILEIALKRRKSTWWIKDFIEGKKPRILPVPDWAYIFAKRL